MDVLVVFAKRVDIKSPDANEVCGEGIIDIQCISEDEPELLQAFMQLIGADRRYIGRGLVQVKLHPSVKMLDREKSLSPMMAIALLCYAQRKRTTR